MARPEKPVDNGQTAPFNRHDIVVYFEVIKGNPNGDPDMEGAPRMTRFGTSEATRESLGWRCKEAYKRAGAPAGGLFIQQDGVLLNDKIQGAIESLGIVTEENKKTSLEDRIKASMELAKTFWDIRHFGAVLGTGKGGGAMSLRGPVQITDAETVHTVDLTSTTIFRRSVTNEKDLGKDGTFGRRTKVGYGLYKFTISICPSAAMVTGMTQEDLDLFLKMLPYIFENKSATSGDINIRKIYDFEHMPPEDVEDGDHVTWSRVPPFKLRERIKTQLNDGIELPTSFEDITINTDFTHPPVGVVLRERVENQKIWDGSGK